MVDEEITFVDEESSAPDSAMSIKDIVLRQIKKLGDICSRELTGGYWQKKPMKSGTGILISEVYQEDLREAYCNCVDFIVDLVYPLSDSTFKSHIDSLKEFTDEEIKDKLKNRKIVFRKINTMFEETKFFESNEFVTQRS